MNSGTSENLHSVWGSSGSDVFAVGSGTILHYNGTSWTAMDPGPTGGLNSIWGSSVSDVFAVDGSGRIMHYDGTSWILMDSGNSNYLKSVWGSSGSDIFAVGGCTILHYGGHPLVTTSQIVGITSAKANAGGKVASCGDTNITARGICWNTSGNPTTADSKTADGTGTGTFTSTLTGLVPDTTYYVRAYATNSKGTSYGSEVTFTLPTDVMEFLKVCVQFRR